MKRLSQIISQTFPLHFAAIVGSLAVLISQASAFDEVKDEPAPQQSPKSTPGALPFSPAIVQCRAANESNPYMTFGVLLKTNQPNRTLFLAESISGAYEVLLKDHSDSNQKVAPEWVEMKLASPSGLSSLVVYEVHDDRAWKIATSLVDDIPRVSEKLFAHGGDRSSDRVSKKLAVEEATVMNTEVSQRHGALFEMSTESKLNWIFGLFDSKGRLAGIERRKTILWDPNSKSVPNAKSFRLVADFADDLKKAGANVPESLLAVQRKRRIERADRFGRPVSTTNLAISWSDEHDELQGMSGRTGKWTHLKIPHEELIIPVVGLDIGFVKLKDSVAAFSPETGTWDILDVPGINDASVTLDEKSVRAFVGENNRFYVFPLNSGEWTSPMDPDYRPTEVTMKSVGMPHAMMQDLLRTSKASLQTFGSGEMKITGIKRRVDEAVAKIKAAQAEWEKANAATAAPNVSPAMEPLTSAEQKSLEFARVLRGGVATERQRKELHALVSKSLDGRLKKQEEQVQALREKLQKVEEALNQRKQARERIIERRVEELLDPNVDWESLMKATSPRKIPYGMPQNGTPIGLRGAPHLPKGNPAGPGISVADSRSLLGGNTTPQLTLNIEIVRELIKRKQFAELSAKPLRDMQRRLEDLGPADGLKGDELVHHKRVARSTRDEIARQQKNLQNALAEWKTTWRNYEGQLRVSKSTVENCESAVQRAESELKRTREASERGYQSTRETSSAEAKVELERLWLLQAREQMQTLSSIAEDSPHLNPENFDIKSLMEPPVEEPKAVTPQ